MVGCSEPELYSQLPERQANEMIAALQSAGIAAHKQRQDGQLSVRTSTRDFSEAVRILSALGYPREAFDTICKLFPKSPVPSPLEERARFLCALSQEISNTLSSIDGVVTARVHLVLPERHVLLDQPKAAAASVFIKHRPERDLPGQVPQIKALVVNSVEGLAYDNVTVALFPAAVVSSDARNAASRESAAASSTMTLTLLAGLGTGAVALGGAGLLRWRRRFPPRNGATEPQAPSNAKRTRLGEDLRGVVNGGGGPRGRD
jgi:type III secretion protein J